MASLAADDSSTLVQCLCCNGITAWWGSYRALVMARFFRSCRRDSWNL